MNTTPKYYYSKPKNVYFSDDQYRYKIIKWAKDYMVEVNEQLDYRQFIEISVSKFTGELYSKPKSSEYDTVKPILEDLFNEYYFQALRYISELNFHDNEFFIIKHSKDWYQLEYYSEKDDKNRLVIDFRDSIDDLWLMVLHDHKRQSRQSARKNGELIKYDRYKPFLNLTLKYLSDPSSYRIYLDDYIKDFKKLANGEEIPFRFDNSSNHAFENIMNQLASRERVIKKELIDRDDLKSNQRTKLRGELEGIKYAMKVIKISR